jgi:FtsP/CotA-like multicopper oxidase with cupredoxin domain
MREITLEAAPTTTTVAGREVELLTYNGRFPGPLLRLVEGEQVRIRLVNRTGAATNLHLHGLPIPPEVDDARIVVGDGRSRDYEFRVREGSAGTYWYHPHGHGSVGPQLFAGLAGPLTVEAAEAPAPVNGLDEHILVLKDLAISQGRPAPHTGEDWLNGKEGDLVLVNGRLNPRIELTDGAVRLRLINACNARYLHLQVEGRRLDYLGAGIGPAERPGSVDSVLLAPGERADVAVRFEEPGEFALVALPYDRGADMSGMAGGAAANHHTMDARLGNAEAFVLATIESQGAGLGPPPELPRATQVDAFPTASEATTRRRLVLSEDMQGGGMRFLINGRQFDPDRIEFECRAGSTEIWEVVNEADMDHPFHVHVFPFVLLSRNGEAESVRMWRDTVNLAEGDRVEILLTFKEFTGTVMYHCHIVEHEDLGMMGLFAVL